MDINSQNLSYLFKGYNLAFQNALKSAQDASLYKRIAREIPSNSESNTYPSLGNMPKMREWIGPRAVKMLKAFDYRIKNRLYEETVAIPRTKIEDDQYGMFNDDVAALGQSAGELPGDMIFEALREGDTLECYDKEPFFSASHPVGDGTESNWGGGSGDLWILLDTNRPLKPMIWQDRIKPQVTARMREADDNVFWEDTYVIGARARGAAGFGLWQCAYGSKQTLDATSFNAAWAQMASLKNDEGADLKIKPNLLVVTPAGRAAAEAVLNAQFLANGASNINYKAVDLLVTNQLG